MIDLNSPTTVRQQLRDLLVRQVNAGEYRQGKRFPSERVLAKKYGVSRTSVRETIAQLLSEGILMRSAGHGTFVAERVPAASPEPTRSRQVGVWINSAIFTFVQPGYSRILTAAGDACRDREYRLQFHSVDEISPSLDTIFAGTEDLAGNLVIGGLNRLVLQRLRELPSPMQVVDLLLPDREVSSVRIDYASGTRQAIEQLKAMGHETIGFIGFPESEKYEAYWQSLEECGLTYHPRFVQLLSVSSLIPGMMAGYQSMQKLIAGQRLPTAVLVTNDYVALGAMEALGIAGIRVPEEISVVGCDDLELSARPLTTIHVDLAEVGRLGANALMDRIEGIEVKPQLVVPVKFVMRETTAPPPAKCPAVTA
jgi:DNA-binding LacI/PurR family transcriptional regulator